MRWIVLTLGLSFLLGCGKKKETSSGGGATTGSSETGGARVRGDYGWIKHLASEDEKVRRETVQRMNRLAKDDPYLLLGVIEAISDEAFQQKMRKHAADWPEIPAFVEIVQSLEPRAREIVDDLVPLLDSNNKFSRLAAADVLGKVGVSAHRAVPGLIRLLDDPETDVRIAAAWALKNMGAKAEPALPKLCEMIGDKQERVRMAAAEALMAQEKVPPSILVKLIDRPIGDSFHRASIRAWAAERLGRLGPEAAEAAPILLKLLDSEDYQVRLGALRGLRGMGPAAKAAGIERFERLLMDPNQGPEIMEEAALVLAAMGAEGFRVLQRAFQSGNDYRVRGAAASGLGASSEATEETATLLVEVLKDPKSDLSDLRRGCRQGLIRMANKAVDVVVKLLSDPNLGVRQTAQDILSEGGEAVTRRLVEALPSATPSVRRAYVYALARTTQARDVALRGILRSLEDSEPEVRLAGAQSLGAFSDCFKVAGEPTASTRAPRGGAPEPIYPPAGAKVTPALREEAKKCLPLLVKLAVDSDLRIRAAALEAISLFDPKCEGAFEAARKNLSAASAEVQIAALILLGEFGPEAEPALPEILALLSGPSGEEKEADSVWRAVVTVLAAVGEPALTPLAKAYRQAGGRPRERLLDALAQVGWELYKKPEQARIEAQAFPVLAEAVKDQNEKIRSIARRGLPAFPASAAALGGELIRETSPLQHRKEGIEILRSLAGSEETRVHLKPVVPDLVSAVGDPDHDVRDRAYWILPVLKDHAVVAIVEALKLKPRTPNHHSSLASVLAGMAPLPETAIPALVESFPKAIWPVRQILLKALLGEAVRLPGDDPSGSPTGHAIPPAAARAFILGVTDEDTSVGDLAVSLLEKTPSLDADLEAGLLEAFQRTEKGRVRVGIGRVLVRNPKLTERIARGLLPLLEGKELWLQFQAALVLSRCPEGASAAVPVLAGELDNIVNGDKANTALWSMEAKVVVPAVVGFLEKGNRPQWARVRAAQLLGHFGGEQAIRAVGRLLADDDSQVWYKAMDVLADRGVRERQELGKVGPDGELAIQLLSTVTRDKEAANYAIRRIRGE